MGYQSRCTEHPLAKVHAPPNVPNNSTAWQAGPPAAQKYCCASYTAVPSIQCWTSLGVVRNQAQGCAPRVRRSAHSCCRQASGSAADLWRAVVLGRYDSIKVVGQIQPLNGRLHSSLRLRGGQRYWDLHDMEQTHRMQRRHMFGAAQNWDDAQQPRSWPGCRHTNLHSPCWHYAHTAQRCSCNRCLPVLHSLHSAHAMRDPANSHQPPYPLADQARHKPHPSTHVVVAQCV